MADHHLLDHAFLPASHHDALPLASQPLRGRGLDRRHIITIDGKSFKPGPRHTLELVQRMTAKQHAANWFWCALELATMGLFFGAGALWMILCHT